MKIFTLAFIFGLLGYTISKPLDAKEATDVLVEHRSSDIDLNEDEQTLPYYGGLKGQFVHVKDDKVLEISNNNEKPTQTAFRQGPTAASSQLFLTEHDHQYANNNNKASFAEDFDKIQQAAARLVAIQELAKRKGTFSAEDNRVYAASLLELGQAAQNLAMLQQTGEIRDFSVLLQPLEISQMPQKTPFGGDKNVGSEAATDGEKVEAVTQQHLSGSELLPANLEDPYEDPNDSVAITAPKKDASVAEARPVGVSIAGDGGVASSKPNALALSGRNGLAVSAPKATAIAGVTAEEAAAFSVSIPSRHNLIIKSATSHLSYPSHDNYDEIDTSPLQANIRSASSGNIKAKPMQATVNAADAIVKMWRTAIAEDHAGNYELREHNKDFNLEQYFKKLQAKQSAS